MNNESNILLVLAGGLGTRLTPAISNLPKAMAPVCGYPFIRYLIDLWVENGINKIIFLLHHMPSYIEEFLSSDYSRKRWPLVTFKSITEKSPLGTGGAVANAVSILNITKPFFIANSDTFIDSNNLSSISDISFPALVAIKVNNTGRFGLLAITNGFVTSFSEKSADKRSGLINGGFYFMNPDIFRNWDGSTMSIEKQVLPMLVSQGLLKAKIIDASFTDIGIPCDYYKFCSWIESNKKGLL